MIASVRGVLALAVIAFALAAIAIMWDRRIEAPVDRALVPGFVAPETLAWTRADGSTYSIAAQDPAANGVIAALRGARWHRDDATTRAGAITTTLVAGPTTIGIGQPLPGTEQQWIVIGGRARLVDAWVARALAPAPWQLRDAHPLAAAADGAITLGLGTRRLAIDERGFAERVSVDGVRLAALRAALRGVTIVGPADPPAPATAETVTVTAGGRTVVGRGPCREPGAGGSDAGRAVLVIDPEFVCVTGWDAVVAAVSALVVDDLADLRPAPFAPTRIVLADGGVLELAPGSATLDGAPADLDAVTELVLALATPGEHAGSAPPAAGAELVVDNRGGLATRVRLALRPPDVVERVIEGVLLRVGTGAFAILARGKDAYRDPTLWREDPASITRLTVDGVAHERAIVVGEWSTAGNPPAPAPAIEALAVALAAPRALPAAAPRAFTPRRRVRLEVTPPTSGGSGAPATIYEVELGAVVAAGCPLRYRGRIVIVDAAACR